MSVHRRREALDFGGRPQPEVPVSEPREYEQRHRRERQTQSRLVHMSAIYEGADALGSDIGGDYGSRFPPVTTTVQLGEAWHYPPELIELVVTAMSLLNKGKQGELDFFRGAGVPAKFLADLDVQVATDRTAISKAQIARQVLVRLNDAGDSMLGPRREVLNRIVRTESFEQCWPDDRLPAKGVVAEIRDVVKRYDAFTRMKAERDSERAERLAEKAVEVEKQRARRQERQQVRADLFALFSEKDPHRRGKQLEGVLNRLFQLDGMGVREAFHLTGDEGEGIVDQIDGVTEIDGELYLVEMKWLADRVGPPELGQHFSRVFLRHTARGIFISASGFTEPAVSEAKLALTRMVCVLCELEEIVKLLDHDDASVLDYFREKVQAAVSERRPLHRPVIRAV